MDKLFETYEKKATIYQRKKWEADCVDSVKLFIEKGQMIRDDFEKTNNPINTDSSRAYHAFFKH